MFVPGLDLLCARRVYHVLHQEWFIKKTSQPVTPLTESEPQENEIPEPLKDNAEAAEKQQLAIFWVFFC